MFLFHVTTEKKLNKILKDGQLKSNKLTGISEEGQGVYGNHSNKFVYFSTTDKLFDSRVIAKDIILYFDSQLLYNRTFYLSTVHTTTPDDLGKWNKGKDYKIKYQRYYKNIDNVLLKLYKNSTSKLPKGKAFQIFQQIAIQNKVNIEPFIVGIELIQPSQKTLNIINKLYPNIKVKIKNKYIDYQN